MRGIRTLWLLALVLALATPAFAREGSLVIVRHGESTWNRAGRFSGWTDVPLTRRGRAQARAAARSLGDLRFDRAFASDLGRAVETGKLILQGRGQATLPITRRPSLRERNYGDLQGMRHDAADAAYGAARVSRWRRFWTSRPPNGESLRDTSRRAVRTLTDEILPAVRAGEHVLVSIHGNTARALVKELDGLSATQVRELTIANGVPLVYRLGDDGRLRRSADGAR